MDAYGIVTRMIARRLSCDAGDLTMGTELIRLGIDSLENIEIVMELEDAFGIDLCPEEPPRTIGDLVCLLGQG